MSSSYTISESITFTVTHARNMAAKVATDLKRLQRLYGQPNDMDIAAYEAEAIEMLKGGYLGTVTYGFRRYEQWIEPTLKFTARDLAGNASNDDDPGRIRAGADVTGAHFYSYMTYSMAWNELTNSEREAVGQRLPFIRGGAPEPSVNGYLTNDRTYSSGGRALDRAIVRSF